MQPQAIFIECGHGKNLLGMTDVGATHNLYGKVITEKQIALDIARLTLDILKSKTELKETIISGVGVSDAGASVQKKMKYVNDVIRQNNLNPQKCLGIAIHCNSNIWASGIEGYHQKTQYNLFLPTILNVLNEYTKFGLRDKFVKSSKESRFGRLYIDDTQANYVLIELGFMGNEKELMYILDNKSRIAEAIAHGILEYIKLY